MNQPIKWVLNRMPASDNRHGGGEEGGLAELLPQLFAGEVAVGHLGHVPAQLLGDVPAHGEGTAQHFECVEA